MHLIPGNAALRADIAISKLTARYIYMIDGLNIHILSLYHSLQLIILKHVRVRRAALPSLFLIKK